MSGQSFNPARLDRLRASRGITSKDTTITAEMGELLKHVKAQARSLGDTGAAWRAAVPESLGAQCELRHVKRGVLTVAPPNASVKFKLDAWLRAGGEQELIKVARSVTKVKLV